MNLRRCIQTCCCYILATLIIYDQSCHALRCYECSESFTDADIWMPLDCQLNVSAVPSRVCNDEQPFCYVSSATVKGILTDITRDCTDQCYYGCVASEFGITTITCTSCCDEDFCNTGNTATHRDVQRAQLWCLIVFSLITQTYCLT
ncbi:hypothetical protein BsWGS_06558 [Bradybaena similaris]